MECFGYALGLSKHILLIPERESHLNDFRQPKSCGSHCEEILQTLGDWGTLSEILERSCLASAMTVNQKANSEEGKGGIPIQVATFRSSELSFCALDDSVVVLDPRQGLYLRLSVALAELLEQVPARQASHRDNSGDIPGTSVYGFKEQFEALSRFGLIEQQFPSETSSPAHSSSEISVWGTLSELTLVTGSPSNLPPPALP